MAWEPFEEDFQRSTMDALIEVNVKLADIRDHLAAIRFMPGDDDGKEEEEAD